VSLEGTGFTINLGDDVNPSTYGNNSIYGNGKRDIVNDSNIPTLEAMDNFWGGTPEASQFGGTNTVTYEPYLLVDPNI
jgi:hypothetical protein